MIWIAIFLIALVGEILTVSFALVWLCIASILAFLVKLGGFSLGTQILVFIISSLILVPLTKPLARRLQKNVIKTNVDSIIGVTGIVIQDIDHRKGTGEVKVRHQIFRARSSYKEVIKVGEEVIIVSIEGNTLNVKKLI